MDSPRQEQVDRMVETQSTLEVEANSHATRECGEPLAGHTPEEVQKWLKKFQLTEEQRTKVHMMLSKAQAEHDNLVQDQMYVTRLATQWGISAADALTMQPDDILKVMTMLAIVAE